MFRDFVWPLLKKKNKKGFLSNHGSWFSFRCQSLGIFKTVWKKCFGSAASQHNKPFRSVCSDTEYYSCYFCAVLHHLYPHRWDQRRALGTYELHTSPARRYPAQVVSNIFWTTSGWLSWARPQVHLVWHIVPASWRGTVGPMVMASPARHPSLRFRDCLCHGCICVSWPSMSTAFHDHVLSLLRCIYVLGLHGGNESCRLICSRVKKKCFLLPVASLLPELASSTGGPTGRISCWSSQYVSP